MKKKTCIQFLLVFVISLTLPIFADQAYSQEEEEAQGNERWAVIDKPFSYQNHQVPRKFWKVVQTVLEKAGHSSNAVENFGILPVSVKVEVSSEDHVVLKNGMNYQVNFVEGGGEVDLFDYMSGKGPLNVRMLPDFDFSKDFHVLYISDSPGKKVEGESWGNACGRIYNLSKSVDKFTNSEGLRTTAARRLYLHLMAGTYVFFQLIEERFYLGYIKLTDSRYPHFTCGPSEA